MASSCGGGVTVQVKLTTRASAAASWTDWSVAAVVQPVVAARDTVYVPEHKRFDNLRVLSVADLLAKAIDHVHSNESVTELFEAIPDD